ncbi:LacI family DNA-binding transcriptional regulator [Jiangella endophytica]|uniref:LacI family DNA-binding transcriptional regulator n=1 Tax=Jiangella endophytica TaxID=1623398 RepID=UPI0022B82BAF|nr:LacI family DNA-binding transcriptional regulator [Jiangella endophytica]
MARHAGVSTAVVSYTLNEGAKKVSDATRARVLEAVRVLGYRPNAAARALKIGSTAQLGLVIPGVLNRFFAELADHAEREAAAHGLALVVTSARDGLAAALGHLASRQVDGVLVVGRADVADLGGLEIPVALLDQVRAVNGVAGIGADRYGGARHAVEHLLGHGHRRVGFVGPAGGSDDRLRGWTDAVAAAGLAAEPLIDSDFTRAGGYEAGRRLASLPDRPSSVFVSSDDQSIGLLLALHEAAVRVPGDVAIVSFDGSQEAAYCWPPLTTVAQPLAEMVRLAVGRVLDPSPGYVELPTELVVRRSCGCR